MSLTEPETQALGSIADGLAGSDPRLASMLTIFSRLAAGRGDVGPREDPGAAPAAGHLSSAPRPAAPAPGHSLPAAAPTAPAAGLAAGHAGAGGRRLRRAAHRRADPHRPRPHDLRPADGNGVPLASHPAACCDQRRTLMRGARK
jgi:hypothetical protein